MQKCNVKTPLASSRFADLVLCVSILLISSVSHAACDYSDADRYDGWGWDADAMNSCAPLPATGVNCDYTNADSYGGWGWDPATRTSCRPLTPVIGECIDSDGDGWGWNGGASCRISVQMSYPDRLVLVDNPGVATLYDYEQTSDGAFDFFQYWGSDLISDDSGRYSDVFLRDNGSGAIKRLTVGSDGTEANNDSFLESVSADGNSLLIQSRVTNFSGTSANGVEQLYLYDVPTESFTRLISGLGGNSPWSSVNGKMSADGNFVAFSSDAANIVDNDCNGVSDVFLLDVANDVVSRVSVSSVGEDASDSSYVRDISADGRYVLFASRATNLLSADEFSSGIYLYDRLSQSNTLIRRTRGLHQATMSDDGSVVVVQYYRPTGMTLTWINTVSGEVGGIDTASAGSSSEAEVSPDGRYVAYLSNKTDLVSDVSVSEGRSLLYLTDLSTGITTLISMSPDGQESNDDMHSAEFIAGGKYLRFTSNATNLHSQDSDRNTDTFLYEMP